MTSSTSCLLENENGTNSTPALIAAFVSFAVSLLEMAFKYFIIGLFSGIGFFLAFHILNGGKKKNSIFLVSWWHQVQSFFFVSPNEEEQIVRTEVKNENKKKAPTTTQISNGKSNVPTPIKEIIRSHNIAHELNQSESISSSTGSGNGNDGRPPRISRASRTPSIGEVPAVTSPAVNTMESSMVDLFNGIPTHDRVRQNRNDSSSTIITSNKKEKEYVEILVHNVSHGDLVLKLGRRQRHQKNSSNDAIDNHEEINRRPRSNSWLLKYPSGTEKDQTDQDMITCRPRFSAFDLFSRRVLSALLDRKKENDEDETKNQENNTKKSIAIEHPVISFPQYERSEATPRYSLVTPRPSRQRMMPVGFSLDGCYDHRKGGNYEDTTLIRKEGNEIASLLRIRGRDVHKIKGFEDAMRMQLTPRESHGMDLEDKNNDDLQATAEQEEFDCEDDIFINGVFFPLLSPLIPRWEQNIVDKFDHSSAAATGGVETRPIHPSSSSSKKKNIKKVVILVTGVGTPRNWTHSIKGNSTEGCAELMELFLNQLYPDITVVRIHSETNIFRYDENISFTKLELMPCIEAYRDALARGEPYPDEIATDKNCPPSSWASKTNINIDGKQRLRNEYNPDWKEYFHVTLSFADGSPARTHAIQAALRPYRPTIFHFWQLKTFWHDSKISSEDIEVLTFEDMETVPAMEVSQLSDEKIKLVVEEIQKFKREFLESNSMGCRSDLKKFWLRKTKKPILAVL